MTRPPFPTVLDSTIIASFRSCPAKCRMEYFEHWKPKMQSVHLVAGAAYAKGLEMAREAYFIAGKPESEAIEIGLLALVAAYGSFVCPPDSAKSLERMMGAFEYYFSQYPLASDKVIPIEMPGGKKGIEFSFAEPIGIAHPESGDPILYVGRLDMLAQYAGAMFGEDDKTTSSLGASWSRQWDLRSQFTGYCWGAERAGFPLSGFIIRGISILKTKYETQQAITYRPKWQLDRWEAQLHRDVARMIECWESGYFDYDLDHACTEYSGCIFRKICLSDNPEPWLAADFERRIWDPVGRTEVRLP